MSSDTKKELKTKNRNSQILSKSSSGAATAASPNNVSGSEKSSSSAFSLLDKLDMHNLKKTTFKYVKSSPQVKQDASGTATRKACIDYALEMVISNLIITGQLDPTKASQMRTNTMKNQIASMCDKILERRAKKAASFKKLGEAKKLIKPLTSSIASSNGFKSKGAIVQRWAVQPAALPITIITDKDLTKVAGVRGEKEKEKKNDTVGKKHGTLQFKSYDSTTSVEEARNLKLKRSRASSAASTESTVKQKLAKQLAIEKNSNATEITKTAKSGTDRAKQEQTQQPVYQASSEVPSNFSLDSNVRLLSSVSGSDRMSLKTPRSVQFERHQEESSKLRSDAPLSTIPSNDATGSETGQDTGVGGGNKQQGNSNANDFPGTGSCPGTAKTLNSIISSSSSISTVVKEFQIVVDMKGFKNDEIAMEVEGRKLIFLASRPKRSDGGGNMRKVTEVVELPAGVKMENLKIGRRKDGFVVIEEHEAEQQ